MSEISQKNEGETILQSAIALSPKIKACTEEIERERRLPMHLIRAMKDAHIFGMAMPRAWGGPELDPITQIRVIEALSVADASVGWCAMIGVDGGYMTGFLDQTVAREMYPDIDVPTAFAASPTGRAVPVEGGYRVSGRWPFASGCHNAEWMIAGCIVSDGEGPPVGADGIPKTRQCFLPASDCQILDTWYTTGLRGTGALTSPCRIVSSRRNEPSVFRKCRFTVRDHSIASRSTSCSNSQLRHSALRARQSLL